MKIALRSFSLLAVCSALTVMGCQGAPCGNCGSYGNNYGPYGQPYAAPTGQAPPPGVVTPPPGAVIQPGVQYPAGSVPVAPQQLQPGAIYGG